MGLVAGDAAPVEDAQGAAVDPTAGQVGLVLHDPARANRSAGQVDAAAVALDAAGTDCVPVADREALHRRVRVVQIEASVSSRTVYDRCLCAADAAQGQPDHGDRQAR